MHEHSSHVPASIRLQSGVIRISVDAGLAQSSWLIQNYKRAYWEIFFSAMRTKGSSSSHFMVLASVMK